MDAATTHDIDPLHCSNSNSNTGDDDDDDDGPNHTDKAFQAEIVGHNGRIGSFLFNAGDGSFAPTSNRPNTQVANIASCSDIGTPILVAVPSTEILNVFYSTPIERRTDLVIIANCLPSRLPEDIPMTYSVLHFGILQQGQLPVTNDLSPPTVVFGPHANFLSNLLRNYGVKTKIASTFMEVEKYALLKLLWVSFMWLLCHDVEDTNHSTGNGDTKHTASLTVTQVHDTKQQLLKALVLEAIPVMKTLSKTRTVRESSEIHDIDYDVNDIMQYLESYSRSMPNVTPSKNLAIAEFQGRNGVLLACGDNDQPLHSKLVYRVVGYIP